MNPMLSNLLDLVAQYSDTPTMAAKALPQFVGYMGADNGSFVLLSEERVVHKVLATKETFTEVSDHKIRTVLAEGLAGWALRHRQGGLASDVTIDSRWTSMGDTSIASALVVPLMSRQTVIGLLSFHHSQVRYFRETHLAQAAELAQLIAPQFDVALLTESTLASLTNLCHIDRNPSVVLDWKGDVKAVNQAMVSLDIAWEGVPFAQTLLPRELKVDAIQQCEWQGMRKMESLPYEAHAVQFRGVGAWIQLSAI